MPINKELNDFIKTIPKAELHIHIEGSLEPELMFKISERNNIKLKYKTVDDLRNAYKFNNLQEFLDIYYEGAGVLLKEQDFYDMTMAYLEKAASDNIIHTEIFFDPQTHTSRGVDFSIVIKGISSAVSDAIVKHGISANIILCFLRHLDEKSALQTLEQALPFKNLITAVGLDSSEVGNPPSKFLKVFSKARSHGFITVAHAGEEGPSQYVREAVDLLKVSRIDHGNRAMEDGMLVKELSDKKIPLTLCPLSNLKLRVVRELKHHPIKKMMDKGLMVTINSDDPAYFGGYLNENYIQTADALGLSKDDIYVLARNSILASFVSEPNRNDFLSKLDFFYNNN
jgi:adenosine deaminase